MPDWRCTVTRNALDIRYECSHHEAEPVPSTERYAVTLATAGHARGRHHAVAARLANSLGEAKWPAEACTMFRHAYVLTCQRLQGGE